MITNITSYHIDKQKRALQRELYENANDPVLLKRRFRMLGQLAKYESQIYKKIHDFETTDRDDYSLSAQLIIKEIHSVVNRNG